MNPFRTLLIHLKTRKYQGNLKTIIRYFQVKYYKYFNKTVNVSVREREQIKLIMHPGCTISEKLYVDGLYDRDGMTTLEKIIKPGEILYDVGANIGPFSLLANNLGISAYAFEGHPETAKRCKENFRINGIDPERVIAAAVSNFDGNLLFTGTTGDPTNKIINKTEKNNCDNAIEVPAISLDTFVQTHEPPSAIKIDTEGHELQVIMGIISILKTEKLIYITFEANGISSESDLREIHKILSDAGFIIGNIDWDRKKFIEKPDLGKKSQTGDYIAISKRKTAVFEQQGITLIHQV